MTTTPASLLERLRDPRDVSAWQRFVRLYSPLLFHWARTTGLQEADAADLVQDVFQALVVEMPNFRYDPQRSFRAWLHRILFHRWHTFQRRKRPAVLGQVDPPTFDADPAWLALEEERRLLVHHALKVLEPEFERSTWQAFRRTAIEGESAADVGRVLNLSTNAVYVARSRVLKRLRQELFGLFD